MISLRWTPSSSRIGCSSCRYSSYWPLFSTFALMPVIDQLRSRDTLYSSSHTLEYSHGSWVVIDSPGGPQSSGDNGWGGHEIVCEGVVEVTLELEDILDRFEFLLVPAQ